MVTERSRPFAVQLDPLTGAEVVRLTSEPVVQHHLYLTTRTCTLDGRYVVFVSHETGAPNLCCMETSTGEIRRLTYRKDLNPLSAVITSDDQAVLYTSRDAVLGATLPEGQETAIARFPGERLGQLCPAPEGRFAAFNSSSGGRHRLTELDLYSGRARIVVDSPGPIGRVQYDGGGERFLYSGEPGARVRVVDRDGSGDRLLYPQISGEWATHETWLNAAEVAFVKFHDGLYLSGLDGRLRTLFKGPIWHVAARADGRLLACDTHAPDIGLILISPSSGKWRTICHPHSSNKGKRWFEPLPSGAPVCGLPETEPSAGGSESDYGPQWTHPHPSFHPDGRRVFFTSDAEGAPHVYRAGIPEEWLDELEG